MSPEPAPVVVANPDPIDVKVTESPESSAQSQARIVAAREAAQADALTTEGQRGINRLWERTQAIIAVSVVFVTLVVVGILIVVPVLRGETITDSAALVLLSALASNIVTSYFTRTNHTKIGGVGGASVGRGE